MFIPAVLPKNTPSFLADAAVRLEFPLGVLVRLLAGGHLYAVEFRCLDPASHQAVRKALLQSCLESLNQESKR